MAATRIADTPLGTYSTLQGYWKLDGDATDSSTNGYTLTEYGTPTYVAGQFGTAVNLVRAGTQYLGIADASCPNLEITGNQTWMAWFNCTSVNDQRMVWKRGTANKGLYLTSSGEVAFYMNSLSTQFANSLFVPGTATWYHACGVYDSSLGKLRVYVNGTVTEVSVTGTPGDTNGDFTLGRNGSTANLYWDGKLDDVAVFSEALGTQQIDWVLNGYTPPAGGYKSRPNMFLGIG